MCMLCTGCIANLCGQGRRCCICVIFHVFILHCTSFDLQPENSDYAICAFKSASEVQNAGSKHQQAMNMIVLVAKVFQGEEKVNIRLSHPTLILTICVRVGEGILWNSF